MNFSQKVISLVAKIQKGKVFTYKEIARRSGVPTAARAVGNILAKNKDLNIPCHRIIRSDFSIGGFRGQKGDSREKAALLLREGLIGIIPTDTIYGILGSALNKSAVEKIYKLRKRIFRKPMIVLISSQSELKKFGIKVNPWQRKILQKIWPGKVSVILNCPSKKFFYLHRGTKTLAFRIPSKKELLKILLITGPVVAPSANWEGFPFSKTIPQAKKYFGNKVFYLNKGKIISQPSTLINLTKNKFEIIRPGAVKINTLI